MRRIELQPGADLDGFRRALRCLIAADIPPHLVSWDDAPGLFTRDAVEDAPPISLPRAVADLIPLLVCHSDPQRYALL